MNKELTKNLLGTSAAICLTITLIPQLYYTWKSKKANDISYGFLSLQITTCFLFLFYGILLSELPLIFANSLVLSQSFLLLGFKYFFSIKKKNMSITI